MCVTFTLTKITKLVWEKMLPFKSAFLPSFHLVGLVRQLYSQDSKWCFMCAFMKSKRIFLLFSLSKIFIVHFQSHLKCIFIRPKELILYLSGCCLNFSVTLMKVLFTSQDMCWMISSKILGLLSVRNLSHWFLWGRINSMCDFVPISIFVIQIIFSYRIDP